MTLQDDTVVDFQYYECDDYGLLLPLIDQDGELWPPTIGECSVPDQFAIVSSDWRALNQQRQIVKPDNYLEGEYSHPSWSE